LRLATMLVALALSCAAPAAAFAQGAGDEQYSDPFGSGQNEDSRSGDEDAGADPGTSEPEQPAPAPEPAPEATASQQEPAGQEQLPYTGTDESLVALAGGMLLVGGVALRVRLRRAS
jgi:LPXTG-motif cell wall-anchored protein